jgi:hypothetical protein
MGYTDHIIQIFPGLSQFLCIVETSKWPNRDTTTADAGRCDAAAARHLSDYQRHRPHYGTDLHLGLGHLGLGRVKEIQMRGRRRRRRVC